MTQQSSEPLPPMSNRAELLALADKMQHALETMGYTIVCPPSSDLIVSILLRAASAPAPAVEVREGWRYEIQHGPDSETDYAWVYDDKNNMVCTTKTHHAMAIVAARGGISLDASDVHYLGAIKLRLERLYEENPNDCRLREHISDEVSWIDGLTEALSASPREMGQESDGNESQAKATEGKAGMAVVNDHVRHNNRRTGLQVGEASADLPTTSEIMDVTARRDWQPIHESDGGSMEQPFALADAARESPAPRASSGKQEGRTGSEVGAEQIAGSSMSYGPDKPIIAGQAPGPSEPSPSSRSEMAWQPIETAPKDGNKIDLWVTPPKGALSTGSYGRVSDCWHSDGRWWFYDETKYASDPANCRSEVWNVTHWMPRPPSPDCSGCRPGGVQKEAHATKQSLSGADNSETETAGGNRYSNLLATLLRWRDRSDANFIELTRGDIITLLNGICDDQSYADLRESGGIKGYQT